MHIILRRTANIYMVLKAEEDLLVLAGLSSAGIYSGKLQDKTDITMFLWG